MGKLFTRFLSMLFVICLFSISIIVNAQAPQKTVQLYAEDVSSCYSATNEYQVKVSVRDFIQLVQFNLALRYETSVFIYKGYTLGSSLSGVNVSQVSGSVNLTWDNGIIPVTIGDGVVTDFVTLKFSIKNYPYNMANSYLSGLSWTKNDFYYYSSTTGKISNNSFPVDGKLNVTVGITNLQVEMTNVDCPEADADIEVTSPAEGTGFTYLFNEDPNEANWTWTTDSHSSAPTGSTNSIRVKDSKGCISLVKTFVVSSVTPVTYTAVPQDALCKGGNGEIQINVSGGTGPYTYWVVPFNEFAKMQTTLASSAGKAAATLAKYKKTNFQILRPVGDYYVAVDDANLCRDLTDVAYWTLLTITEPAKSLAIIVSNVKGENCSLAKDGSFDVTVSGGANPEYQVSIQGQSATTVGGSYSFTGVPPGDYVVEVMDINGCKISSETITIAPKTPITFAISVENTSCGGLNDGTINVMNIVGGTAPYKLTIVTGVNSTIQADVAANYKFTNLSPDYYSLTITDANNCTVNYINPVNSKNEIELQSPLDIKFSLDIQNTLCFVGDATVKATGVTGGAGIGYMFSIDGVTWQASNMFTILQPFALSYTVSVKNIEGYDCTTSKTFTIVAPSKLLASLRPVTAPNCAEGNDGKIEIDISGGTIPYSYSVNSGSWIAVSGALLTINSLPMGDYLVNIKDANGCLIPDPLNIVITQDKNIITATATKIGCFGYKAPIIASWTSWADKGVSRIIQYKYALSEVALSTSGIGFIPGTTPFAAGTYYVGAIDQFGCMSNVVPVVINQNDELILSSVVANAATCFGTATGTITIQAIGGTVSPLLQYVLLTDEDYTNIDESKWVNFDTFDEVTKLSTVSLVVPKGVYFVSVRDNHCDDNHKEYGPITVEGYEQLLVNESLITKVNVLCWNNATGSVNVPMNAVSGGAGAYLFTLLDASGIEVPGKVDQPTGMFANVKAGTYSILVNDIHDCTPYTTAQITITEPAEIVFTVSSQNTTGFGIEDGKIDFTAVNGGNGIYTAVVTGIAADGTSKLYTQSISDVNGWTISNVAASEAAGYDVKILDGNNCESVVKKIVVLQPDKLVVTLTKGANEFSCPDIVEGLIEATATGGFGVYTYSLFIDDVLNTADVNQTSFLVQTGHTFKVVVKDENGNTANASLSVIPVVPVAVTISDMTCFGEPNPIAEIEITGEPGRTFRLQYASVIDGLEGAKSAVIPVTDTYSFISDLPYGSDGTIIYNFYVDDMVCAVKAVTQTFVKVVNAIDVSIVQIDNEVSATLTVTGGVAPYTYVFGASQGVANSGEPFVVNGIKTVSTNVTISDAHGCTVLKSLIATPIAVTADPSSGDNQTNNFNVVLTFNRSVSIATGDITGGTYTPGTGTSFTVAMTGVSFADLTLALGTGIVDAAGNTFVGKSFIYKVGDFTSPTLVVTPPSSPVAKTFTVGLKFSEPVNGISFNSPNIQITNGTILSVTGNADIYTFIVSAAEQANVIIVLTNEITDKSINANKFAGVTLRYNVGDFTKPTLIVTPPTTPVAKKFTVGLKFSEPVNGVSLTSPAVKVTGATLLSVVGADDAYTLTISGTDLANVKIVLSNGITDKSASANKFDGITLNYTIGDFTGPLLVTMTPNANTVLTDTHPTFKMTFNENIKLGDGGNLVVYKLNSTIPVLTIPITSSMISGKDVNLNYGNSGLDRNTRYYVLVDGSALTDIAGNKFAGVKSVTVWTFKTGANWPTGNIANPNATEFNVYPNPFYDVINLVASTELSKVIVTNIAGQLVKEVVNPGNSILLSELRSGIYFISLYDMDNVIVKTAKIVKR